MQYSQLPTKFQIAFASGAGAGYIRAIPTASQIGINNGAASLTDGFVPLNFQPVGSGGIPPSGQDFNGILNQITAWCRAQAAGQLTTFDPTFSGAIGGYPMFAVLASTTPGVMWISTADNNTTNPDGSSSSGWTPIGYRPPVTTQIFLTSGTFTWPQKVTQIRVRCWAAGGSTAASSGTGNYTNGAGGGGYAEKYISGVAPGTQIPVTVGIGGARQTNNVAGQDGGTSSFGTYCGATGGRGASGTPGAGADSGYGYGGDLNFPGGQGYGAYLNNFAGSGGNGGGGGGAGGPGGQSVATDGRLPGGGGAGAGTGSLGSNGGNGLILVDM